MSHIEISPGTTGTNSKGNDGPSLDILFVHPALDWKGTYDRRIENRIQSEIPWQETPHIAIAYLMANALRHGIHSEFIDMVTDGYTVEDLLGFIGRRKPTLVGFTAFTIQINQAGEIARRIKEVFPNVKTCVGGAHTYAVPELTVEEFPAFDFAVRGEAEHLLHRIMDALDDEEALSKVPGVYTRRGGTPPITLWDLESLPMPYWEGLKLEHYPGQAPHRTNREVPVITGRGCPFKCTFCCRALGDTDRRRSVQSVVNEIRIDIEKLNCGAVTFFDETLVTGRKWTTEFLEAMTEIHQETGLIWSCEFRASQAKPDLFERLGKAGCYYVFFGLESATEETLMIIKKGTRVDDMRFAVKLAKENGIISSGSFIIGLPGDTEAHVYRDIELAKELDLYSVTFPIAVPFPGTQLREAAERGDFGMRIVSNNWADYGKQEPGTLESDALLHARRNELKKIAGEIHPRKDLDDYLRRMVKEGYPYGHLIKESSPSGHGDQLAMAPVRAHHK